MLHHQQHQNHLLTKERKKSQHPIKKHNKCVYHSFILFPINKSTQKKKLYKYFIRIVFHLPITFKKKNHQEKKAILE